MMTKKAKAWFMMVWCFASFVALSMFAVHCARSIDSEYQANECEEKVQQAFQPEALREWAAELLANDEQYQDRTKVPIPSGLRQIWKRPPSVEIRGKIWGNKGPAYVWVRWGSGVLGRWGMAIGPADLAPPPEITNARKWQDGIYFWRELS